MKYALCVILVLAFAPVMLEAQGLISYAEAANMSTYMLRTDKGIFALREGVLVKYDAKTLKPLAELQIYGPAPILPEDMLDQTAVENYRTNMKLRLGYAFMLATKDSIIVVIGNGFGRINQNTFKIEARTSLKMQDDDDVIYTSGDQISATLIPFVEPRPAYQLDGNTLYIIRGKHLLSINIANGNIIACTLLPKDMLPPPPKPPTDINAVGAKPSALPETATPTDAQVGHSPAIP